MIDVTDLQQAEETLRILEQRYQLLFERNMAGVLRTGVDGTVLEVNDAFARILGFGSRDDLRDCRVEDFYYRPADREAMLKRLQSEGGLSNYELCLRRQDGSPVWVLANIVLNEGPSGPDVVQSTIIDITERKRTEEALLLFRALIDRSNDGIEVIDPETGRFLDVNEAACQAHGYTRDEFLTLSVWDIAPTADPTAWLRNLEQLRRLGSRLHVGLHRRKDGSTFPVEVNITFVRLNRDYIVAVVRDVTERRQAEEALRDSEQRFRTFVDHATDAFLLHDDQGTILDVNPQACEDLGYARDELVGKTPLDINPDVTPAQLEEVQRRLDAGEFLSLERRHRRKDGSIFPVEIRLRPFCAGGRRFAVALVRDITERKRAEEAVRKSEERLRQAVRVSNLGIFEHDHRTDTVYWSPEQRSIHCWEAEKAPSISDFVGLLHPEDRERIAAAIRRAHDPAGDGIFDVEQRIVRPDGEVRWLVTRSQTSFEGDGDARHLVRTVGAVLDITELKRLEEQFRQAQKMEAVGQLAGGVAHDFNNLLTVINGFSELAFHQLRRDDSGRELLAEVLKAGERAAALTRQLLAFSRKQVLQPRVLDINALLGELSKMLLRLLGANIGLRLETDAALGLVKVDPCQFEQAIINLAVNARDAMPGGGRLTIETRNAALDKGYAGQHPDASPGRYIQVAMSDTGHGMDAATRARIFEPFFTTKEQGRGTGLGLAMVYGFVKQSGGHIEAESEVGRGTTFKIYLPRTDETTSSGRSSQDFAALPGGAETILLVEDQDAVRTYARHVLLAGGYTVLEARDGEEALRVAQQCQGRIHLVLTDVIMPRMGGRQLAELLVRDRLDLRVLFMSGYTDEALTRSGAPETGAAFLQKPFNPVQLARKVREVLDADTVEHR